MFSSACPQHANGRSMNAREKGIGHQVRMLFTTLVSTTMDHMDGPVEALESARATGRIEMPNGSNVQRITRASAPKEAAKTRVIERMWPLQMMIVDRSRFLGHARGLRRDSGSDGDRGTAPSACA
jgi:hypothetical protein